MVGEMEGREGDKGRGGKERKGQVEGRDKKRELPYFKMP